MSGPLERTTVCEECGGRYCTRCHKHWCSCTGPDNLSPDDREELNDVLTSNEALLANGFEAALIGWAERFNSGPVALYDRDKCLRILVERDGMTWEDAEEFFQFNVTGAWVGEGTPIFARLLGTTSVSTSSGCPE